MASALVTGVAGFIGSNLAAALLDRGDTVTGVDNFATGHRRNVDRLTGRDGFTFHEADIRDGETMAELTSGVDHVYHQAAIPSVPRSVDDPVLTTDANCTGTAVVIDAARRANITTVVVASSSSVYGSSQELPKVETMTPAPESPYALSKYYTEALAMQADEFYEIDVIALRYFNIFGSWQDPSGEYAAVIPTFIDRMLDGRRPVIFGDGEQSRDFTYIDNAVKANLLAADGDVSGEVINVACGGSVTVNELVDRLNDVLDTDLEPIHDDPRPGDVRHSQADISKAEELLGYEPEVDFVDGLERTVDFFRRERE